MATRKLYIFERFLLVALLGGAIWGFWYFEESLTLRILILGLSIFSLALAFLTKDNKLQFSSRRELLMLLILYLGLFSLYNLLYSQNIPLYLIMIAILALVSILLYSLLSLDEIDKIMGLPIFQVFIFIMGLTILEVFLSLYFWPIEPEVKSLIIVVVFYLIISLIYLYVHSMLRLKRIAGYLIVCFLILTIILLITWFRLSKGGLI